ncbi:PLD nuclease N-terminal domain-containing protein [Arthrobacter sp. Sr24]
MRYIIPVTIGVVLFVYGLIDCIRSEARDVRSIPKPAWILVIIFLNVIGVALWFLFGRPRYARSGSGSSSSSSSFGPTSSGQRRPTTGGTPKRSTAPDDDPEFLRNLAVKRAQKLEAERLRKLKADLDAREAKLREEHPNDETKK